MELLTYEDTRTQFFNDQIKRSEETMEGIKRCDVSEITKHIALSAEELAIGFYREALNALNWNKIEFDEEGFYTNLPKEGEKVLFCKKNGDMYIGEVFNDKFYDDGDKQVYLGYDDYLDGVVAWMPLPNPYKENK